MSKRALIGMSLFVFMFGFVLSACATIVDNDPSNDTMTGASLLGYSGITPWSDIGNCTFDSSDDVDYFAINLVQNNVITIVTTPLSNDDLTDPDSYIALLDETGDVLASSENPGGNVIRQKINDSGKYYIKTYTSPGDSWNYSLLVGVTHLPEPATIGLLFLGGLSVLGRRKRK